jgi:hypothetical protein
MDTPADRTFGAHLPATAAPAVAPAPFLTATGTRVGDTVVLTDRGKGGRGPRALRP